MKKFSLYFVLLLIFSGLGFFFFSFPGKIIIFENQTASFSLTDIGSIENKDEDKIILMAVGDIMLDRGVEYKIINNGDFDFKFPFLKIKNYLDKADILFGNLESIISNKGEKEGSIYSFRAEPRAMDGLVYAGFALVSVANNHAFDYGKEAFLDNLVRLKNAGIEYAGGGANEEEAFSLKIKEVKGTKIGFLAYSNVGVPSWKAQEDRPGIAFIEAGLSLNVAEAKKQVDVLVVSIHWGEEYVKKPSSSQTSLAKNFLDEGADIIIGHHSHVPQPVVKLGTVPSQQWITYSLGNFVFDQYFSEETMEGLLLEIIIENKKIKEVNQKQIKINQFYQPELSTE